MGKTYKDSPYLDDRDYLEPKVRKPNKGKGKKKKTIRQEIEEQIIENYGI